MHISGPQYSSLSSPNLSNITYQIKRGLTLASRRSLNMNKSCPVRVYICGCFWINLQSPFLRPVNFGVFITTFHSLFPFVETVEWVYITPGLELKLFKKACKSCQRLWKSCIILFVIGDGTLSAALENWNYPPLLKSSTFFLLSCIFYMTKLISRSFFPSPYGNFEILFFTL